MLKGLKYITFILLVPGIQSVSVPGQLVYLSEERVAFHNVPMYSRARRMFVMTNQSVEHTTHFEWHVTSLKDSQVRVTHNKPNTNRAAPSGFETQGGFSQRSWIVSRK